MNAPHRFVIQVTAGGGPAEVRAFVARLAAHLAARCRDAGLAVERVDARGDEPEAPRSVEIVARGDASAFAAEVGTHALLGRSASRGRDARKRWFAGVAVYPLAVDGPVAFDPRDLAVTAVRSSGPGGQHVNKVATAVRVRHAPSGIEVKVSDERSQRANLRRAVERITARLAKRADAAHRQLGASRRAAHHRLERGAPVRTYRDGPRGALVALGGAGEGSEERRAQ